MIKFTHWIKRALLLFNTLIEMYIDFSIKFLLNFVTGAIPSDEQVRVTPSLKDQRGGLWAKTKTSTEYWEIEVFFRVSGRGRVGGDGLVSS